MKTQLNVEQISVALEDYIQKAKESQQEIKLGYNAKTDQLIAISPSDNAENAYELGTINETSIAAQEAAAIVEKIEAISPELLFSNVNDITLETEEVKEKYYELLIPEEYQLLRQYLENDGFLANEEINAALRDARLTREELQDRLAELQIPTADQELQTLMGDYLWELHEIVQDPSLDQLKKEAKYELLSMNPVAVKGDQGPEGTQQDTSQDKSIEVIPGGLVANYLHNFKKMYGLKSNPTIGVQQTEPFQWKDIEQSLASLGITKESLEQSGNLKRLLAGEKTTLMTFTSPGSDDQVTMEGKLYLVKVGEEIVPHFQARKVELQLPDQYLGYTFTEEDKRLLRETGELGLVVELNDQNKPFKAFIGVDPDTNSLTVWPADRVNIPARIHGVVLTAEEQQSLQEGYTIRLDGLLDESGQHIDAYVQVSAATRSLAFTPVSEPSVNLTLDNETINDLEKGNAITHDYGVSSPRENEREDKMGKSKTPKEEEIKTVTEGTTKKEKKRKVQKGMDLSL